MIVNSLDEAEGVSNQLGAYLRDRRARINPAMLGIPSGRRRTPGLRREEVAQRAHISTAWYTWLEQGRGGAPSSEVLGRLADSLMLNKTEREHLFFLAFGRAPQPNYEATTIITPRLQRFLDRIEGASAFIKSATGEVVGWNRASLFLLGNFQDVHQSERNCMKIIFKHSLALTKQDGWESIAKFSLDSFRAEAIIAGATNEITELVEDLRVVSPEFRTMWADHDVRNDNEGRILTIHRPFFGQIELEHSRFAVDGRPDFTMIVHHPVDSKVHARTQELLRSLPG
jgi:transcriptional regulator with XRE-family HTH domain